MEWNEEKQVWENLTEQEQKLADAMFKKGFSQAKKKVEEPHNPQQAAPTGPSAEALAEMVKLTVSDLLAPLQSEFTNLRTAQKENLKQSVVAKQQQKLPATYLDLVTGNTEEEITTSYKNIYEQYQNELKSIGFSSNFGAPTPNSTNPKSPNKKFSEMSAAEKIELCKTDPELYSRLRSSK